MACEHSVIVGNQGQEGGERVVGADEWEVDSGMARKIVDLEVG